MKKEKRILFFIGSLLPGGRERRMVELICSLSKKSEYLIEVVINNPEIHYNQLINMNIKIHVIKKNKRVLNLNVINGLNKIVNFFNPDIIHVWGNLPAFYSIPISIFKKIPLINSQIADSPKSITLFNKIICRINFFYSKKVIANSYAGLNSYNVQGDKYICIHNGFDFNRLNSLEDKIILKRKFNILTNYLVGMVATFSHLKDYDTYIEASIDVLKKRSDVTFLCIGHGDYSKFQNVALRNNLSERILFLGNQKNIESIMNIIDIGVLTSFNEGFPNAIMEFMALKKPTIATKGGGVSELVINNKTGFLIDQKNSLELSNKIQWFLDNPNEMKSFGENAKNRVLDEFTIDKMVNEYMKIYNSVLN